MSNLSADDVKRIVAGIQGHTMSQSQTWAEVATKVLVGLCTAGILWIAKGVNDLQGEQIRMDEWRKLNVVQMELFTRFMEKPRFLLSDYNALTKPLTIDVNRNTAELKERRAVVSRIPINTADIKVIKDRLIALENK